MAQSLKSIKANIIVSATSSITTTSSIGGNLLPTANVTYDLGSSTARWKDIYLSNNTIYLGNTAVSANSILPINLDIAPEVLTINVAAPFPGDDIKWLWNWQTSTLPYARTTIVNSEQVSVPVYKQGTYQINNFANQQTGTMTQRHGAHLKWIDGAGVDNLVSWAVKAGNVSFSDSNINSGSTTTVQRINVTVPASITLPTLVAPNISNYMTVSCVNAGAYTFDGNGDGDNRTLGPLYRGGTYTFTLDSSLSGDPFYFTTDNGTNWASGTYHGEYTTGVTGSRNDGTTGKTTIRIVVDATAPDVLFYQSATNASKRGAIIIKDLAVETNINGNYVLYFQHTGEGHKTPVEIRPIPSLVNQMCVVYDATVGKFVPQDLATYVENTPSFKNKIREVAGTATLIAPNGVAVVPTVLIVEDTSYLPLINNKDGDIAFDAYYDTIYVWEGNAWRNSKPTSVATVTTNAQPNITSVGTLTNLSVSGNATITGNLIVSGTTTTINSTTVTVNDLNLVLANNATTAAESNGAGITINGAGATMNYISSSNSFTFSHKIVADGSLLTSLTGANISGAVAYATTANSVAVANVSGIGNIATVNKDGNASNILYGNGVFAAPAVVSSYGNSNVVTLLGSFGSNTIVTTGNISSGNANLGNLTTSNYFSGVLTTASQPNITSIGTLSSLSVTGNVALGGANVSIGAVGNLKITGGTANYYLKTDGTGNLSWSAPVSVQNYVKTYYWQGGLTENVGTLRFYIHTATTLNTIALNLVSAGLTQSTFVVKKNGTSINTITVPAGNVAVSQTGLAISLAANDYLTVDITQSSSASDAYINLIYTG